MRIAKQNFTNQQPSNSETENNKYYTFGGRLMTKREFMEQQLNHMAEEGMVRKSDVISIVEKQKTSIHESDSLYESLKEFKEEYHSTGEFVVDGNSYSIEQMLEELRNDTKIGREFRKSVNKMILTYMMKFGGDEEN